MRLIDADAFKEKILNGTYIYCQENKEDIARAIDCEPTITNRPKAIWIKKHNYLSLVYHVCSICRSEPLELNDYEYLSNFCPNCGACMKDEVLI